MTKPEYAYGTFDIRRRCAWVDDPETLQRDITERGANHAMFWAGQYLARGRGWYLELSTWAPGVSDKLSVFRFMSPKSLAFSTTDPMATANELMRVESLAHIALLRAIDARFAKKMESAK